MVEKVEKGSVVDNLKAKKVDLNDFISVELIKEKTENVHNSKKIRVDIIVIEEIGKEKNEVNLIVVDNTKNLEEISNVPDFVIDNNMVVDEVVNKTNVEEIDSNVGIKGYIAN